MSLGVQLACLLERYDRRGGRKKDEDYLASLSAGGGCGWCAWLGRRVEVEERGRDDHVCGVSRFFIINVLHPHDHRTPQHIGALKVCPES